MPPGTDPAIVLRADRVGATTSTFEFETIKLRELARGRNSEESAFRSSIACPCDAMRFAIAPYGFIHRSPLPQTPPGRCKIHA